MSKGEIGPRDLLVDRAKFGQDKEAFWRPYGKDDRAKVGAAYYQHLVVIKARERIESSLRFRTLAQFVNSFDPPDRQLIRKKFNGSRRAQMEDYVMWAYFLGRRILLTWKRGSSRDLLFPDHLLKPTSETDEDVSPDQ